MAPQKKEKKGESKPGRPNYVNRNAYRNYDVIDKYEAGISLAGQEVKSIRTGGVDMKNAYGRVINGEVIIFDLNIAPYKFANIDTLPRKRPRRLLLNKSEIRRIRAKVEEKGMTLIPLKIYFSGHLVKVEIGVCKGKRLFEKRDTIAKKDVEREKDRELRERG